MSDYNTLPVYQISPHVTGDTWRGIPLITLQKSGSGIDLTDVTVEMKVRYQIDSPSVINFSTVSISGLILEHNLGSILLISVFKNNINLE
jgi:hypothetical protein